MKVPSDVICGVCKKVFCCAECRYKHEIKTHAIIVQKIKENEEGDGQLRATKFETTNIYLFCPICQRKPMPLQREMYAEMLAHVEEFHLPLRCRNCFKVYNRIDDLQNFSKCTHTTIPTTCCYPHEGCCNHYDQTCDTVTMQKELAKVTISTQTSPQPRQQNAEFHQTPMSLINLRWKAKSKLTHEEMITDSISSLKNISSISNVSVRRSLDAIVKPKGQLVRTTSTPVSTELLYTKHTERTFNASGGQVSSIHHSNVDADNYSPAITSVAAATSNTACLSPNRQHFESFNRYLKVGGARAKMTAVTPLRQVMSKSIQKAFAEHGGLPTTTRLSIGADFQPLSKKLLDSHANDVMTSPAISPLDLRLSPAVRRTHHEIHTSQVQAYNAWLEQNSAMSQNVHQEVLSSSQKLTTTESIVITRTTQHMTSIESAASNSTSSDSLGSIASKISDKSSASSTANTSYNSAVSSSGSGSVYKSCESIEIITATTALNDIHQGYYAAVPKLVVDNGIKKIAPTMETEAQVVSSNLPPITPITRIPGALINKKLIRFDSPCEEDELKMEKSAKFEDHEHKKNCASLDTANTQAIPPKHNVAKELSKDIDKCMETPLSTNNSISKIKTKLSESPINSNSSVSKLKNKQLGTPLNTNSSVSEAFFTPNATPIRRNKKKMIAENANILNDLNRGTPSSSAPSLRKIGKSTTFNRLESNFDNDNENDDVSHHGTIPKHDVNQNTTAALGRSWSFSAILGSMMRLPSKSKETPVEKVKTPSPQNSNSLIQRCASLAGSLVRSQSLIDKAEELRHQKRKRCYTTEAKLLTNTPYEQNYMDPLSPTTENSLRRKRFRIHGRKPIERMRKDI